MLGENGQSVEQKKEEGSGEAVAGSEQGMLRCERRSSSGRKKTMVVRYVCLG